MISNMENKNVETIIVESCTDSCPFYWKDADEEAICTQGVNLSYFHYKKDEKITVVDESDNCTKSFPNNCPLLKNSINISISALFKSNVDKQS
jgi:hypothetical protein